MSIEIEEDNSSPFVFAELKEMDNEESTEGNQSKRSSMSSAVAMELQKIEANTSIEGENVDESSMNKKEGSLSVIGAKESHHPNIIEQPGRLSL